MASTSSSGSDYSPIMHGYADQEISPYITQDAVLLRLRRLLPALATKYRCYVNLSPNDADLDENEKGVRQIVRNELKGLLTETKLHLSTSLANLTGPVQTRLEEPHLNAFRTLEALFIVVLSLYVFFSLRFFSYIA